MMSPIGPLLVLALLTGQANVRQVEEGWLDRPLANWNRTGSLVPPAPSPPEPLKTVIGRCKLAPLPGAAAGRLSAAGWLPFRYFGKPLTQDDVEIIGGMTGADGMCRPTGYNVFVFVGGRYAGTLSPAPMTSRQDAASGEVRLSLPEINAEFARYTEKDPLCCPSSRVMVRFSVDRTNSGVLVVPFEKTTR